jgi:hypothetical protein
LLGGQLPHESVGAGPVKGADEQLAAGWPGELDEMSFPAASLAVCGQAVQGAVKKDGSDVPSPRIQLKPPDIPGRHREHAGARSGECLHAKVADCVD